MVTHRLAPFTLSGLLALMLPACSDSATGDADTGAGIVPGPQDDQTPRMPLGTSLLVEVTDPDGNPIAKATVTIPPLPELPGGATPVRSFSHERHLTAPQRVSASGVTYQTDNAGRVLLEELEQLIGDRLVARVEAPGYASASIVLNTVQYGAHMGARAILVPVSVSVPFDPSIGVDSEHEGVRVVIPADSVVDEDGTPVSGLVELQIVPFESTSRALEMPGPLSAIDKNKQGVALETLAMAEISLWQEGRRLQLADGAHANVTLPLPKSWTEHPDPARRPVPGTEIPAWYFDLDRGTWIEEGSGVIRTNEAGMLVWTADVPHFTWWNCDTLITEFSCFLVTVEQDGLPLAGVQVLAVGVSYEGDSGYQVTDGNGQVCTEIMVGGTAEIYIGDPNQPLVPPVIIQGANEYAKCTGEGGPCQQLEVDVPPGCEPGQSFKCAYGGPPNSEDVGICRAGTNYCGPNHKWTGCEGEQLPLPEENPGTPEDDDCNGDPGNVPFGDCLVLDAVAPCYEGPSGTYHVGICTEGLKTCIADPNDPNHLIWGKCTDIGPDMFVDDCFEPDVDSDCDGESSCGYAEWAQSFGDVDRQHIAAVSATDNGDIYAVGAFLGSITLGNLPPLVNNDPTPHVFLARFLSDGSPDQIIDLGASLGGELELATRGVDEVFITASLGGMFTDGACMAATTDGKDGVVLRYAGMSCQEALPFGAGDGIQLPSGLAVHGDRLYLAGAFTGTVQFGNSVAVAAVQGEAFLVALDPANLHHLPVFLHHYTTSWSPALPTRPAVAADADGCALALAYTGSVTVGGVEHNAAAPGRPLVARFDDAGVAQWSSNLAYYAAPPLSGLGVAVDSEGAVTVAHEGPGGLHVSQWLSALGPHWEDTVAGAVLPQPNYGGARLTVNLDRDIVVHGSNAQGNGFYAKWSEAGSELWNSDYGVSAPTEGYGVAISPTDQRVLISGRFTADFTLPDGLNVQIGDPGDLGDGFFAKLNP